MRTLKKALSLVLVLAMVFALAVPGFAVDKSSEYTDYADVKNTEAVDVLTALDVLNGNDDGSFGPEGSFTRAQAATIIANLMMGSNVKALAGIATGFNDVPATHWASGYIQYCVSTGILSGYGDGNFGPDDALTATQWSLMLLGALGYKAANEGIGGTGWEIPTTTLAIKTGIASADDLTGTFNRDAAAKLALNALKADCVEYVGGTKITIGDTTITQGATRQVLAVANGTAANDAIDDTTITRDGDTLDKIQLGEQLYSGKLSYAAAATGDSFGRSAMTWTYKNSPVGTYANVKAAYTATVSNTTAFSAANVTALNAGLNKVLGITATSLKVTGADEEEVYINGQVVSNGATVTLNAGDVVEVYTATGSTTDVTKVVVLRQSYAKILDVVANTGKAKAVKTDANGDRIVYNYKITLDTNGDTTADITTNDIDLAGYTSEFVKGAYLNLYVKTGTTLVGEATIAETATGAITAFTADANATMAGTKYIFANASIVGHDTGVDFKTGDYTLVLDDAGYVTAVITNAAAAATLKDVVYTNGKVWTDTSTKYGVTTTTVYTQVVNVDGTVSDIEIGAYKTENNGTKDVITELYDETSVITVTTNGASTDDTVAVADKGENLYTIADVAATATVPAHKKLVDFAVTGYSLDNTTLANNGQIKTTDTKLLTTGKYIGSDTLFTQITGSGTTTKAATYTGSMGYKNTSGSAQTVYYIYKTTTGALSNVVVLTNALTTTTADVLYISAATSAQNGLSTYLQENVYNLKGEKLDPITVISGDQGVTGFVTYSVTDGKYDLTTCATGFVGSNTDWSTSHGVCYYEGVTFVKDFYADYASFKNASYTLFDIPAANMVVVDLRTAADKAAGYDADLTSLADILAADATIKTEPSTTYDVTGAVYLSADGVATFFVTTVN